MVAVNHRRLKFRIATVGCTLAACLLTGLPACSESVSERTTPEEAVDEPRWRPATEPRKEPEEGSPYYRPDGPWKYTRASTATDGETTAYAIWARTSPQSVVFGAFEILIMDIGMGEAYLGVDNTETGTYSEEVSLAPGESLMFEGWTFTVLWLNGDELAVMSVTSPDGEVFPLQ